MKPLAFCSTIFCKGFSYFETIDLQSLKLWCDDVLHGKNGCKQWTRKTLKTKIGWANKLWAYCEKLSITMAPNIAVAMDVMPVASRTKSSRKKRNASYNSFSIQQCFQALDAAKATDKQQLEYLILLAMYTGCSLGELTHMKVEQVSKDRFTVEDTKTDAGEREILIHTGIQQVLERMVQTSTDGFLISGLSNNIKYKSRSKGISHRFMRIKNEIGFEKKVEVFHSFRATLSELMENAGVSENFAAGL